MKLKKILLLLNFIIFFSAFNFAEAQSLYGWPQKESSISTDDEQSDDEEDCAAIQAQSEEQAKQAYAQESEKFKKQLSDIKCLNMSEGSCDQIKMSTLTASYQAKVKEIGEFFKNQLCPEDEYDFTFPWGGFGGQNIRRTARGRDSYVIKIVTNNPLIERGQVAAGMAVNNSVYRVVAISKRPGDFNVSTNCKRGATNIAVVKWVHDKDLYGSCRLERNTTYYINIAHQMEGRTTCHSPSGCDFYFSAFADQTVVATTPVVVSPVTAPVVTAPVVNPPIVTPPVVTGPSVPPVTTPASGSEPKYHFTFPFGTSVSTGNIRRKARGLDSYVIKIVTNNPQAIKGQFIALTTSSNSAFRTMAVSTKAGDFNVPTICKRGGTNVVALNWTHDNTWGACKLERNKTYYINISHQDDGVGTCSNPSGCDFYFGTY